MKRLIVGMSGSSAVIYGIRLLEKLAKREDVEVHLVISQAAKMTIGIETDYTADQVEALADEVHNCKNIGASIASGSFKTAGMVVVPCSMKTLSAISTKVGSKSSFNAVFCAFPGPYQTSGEKTFSSTLA